MTFLPNQPPVAHVHAASLLGSPVLLAPLQQTSTDAGAETAFTPRSSAGQRTGASGARPRRGGAEPASPEPPLAWLRSVVAQRPRSGPAALTSGSRSLPGERQDARTFHTRSGPSWVVRLPRGSACGLARSRRREGGFGGRGAPPRGDRRDRPGSPLPARAWPPRPSPPGPALAPPPPPGPPLTAVAPPLTLPPAGADSARRARGRAPCPPRLVPPPASPNTETPQVILLLPAGVSDCPWAPPPSPSSGSVARWGHADRRRASILGSRGRSCTPATGNPAAAPPDARPAGARGPQPLTGKAGRRRGSRETRQRETPAATPGLRPAPRASSRSSSRCRRPPAGAAGSRSCALRGPGGLRSAAAAR